MRTIETTANVSPNGELSVRVPSDVEPGQHRVVIVIGDPAERSRLQPRPDLPILDLGPWPPELSLQRSDMYDDDGR